MDTTDAPVRPDPLAGSPSGPLTDLLADPAPTFSVIIPTFRRPALLAEAIASVLAQTRSDWECLVVDDGGGQVHLPPDPRVRLISRTCAGGPAAARNTGIEAARGRYLTFLDDDDRYLPQRLELAEAGLARAPVAICWTRWFEPDRPDAEPSSPGGRWLVGDVSEVILDSTTPHLGSVAVRAADVVLFDVRYRAVEDVEWWLRMAAVAPVDTIAEVGCEMRRHDGKRDNGTGMSRRRKPNRLLLRERRAWFAVHPRARAFRWHRMAAMALVAADHRSAVKAEARSLAIRPSWRAARGLVMAPLPPRRIRRRLTRPLRQARRVSQRTWRRLADRTRA